MKFLGIKYRFFISYFFFRYYKINFFMKEKKDRSNFLLQKSFFFFLCFCATRVLLTNAYAFFELFEHALRQLFSCVLTSAHRNKS